MSITNYILLSNVYLTIFYVFYIIALKQETFFQLNRFYLLSAAVSSFIIPFIKLDWIYSFFGSSNVDNGLAEIELQINNSLQLKSQSTGMQLGDYMLGIYIIVTGFLFVRFVWNLAKILFTLKASNIPGAFSFFKLIQISDSLDDKKEIITAHEMVHVRQLHSLDVILFELLRIFNWFNPIVYSYKNQIKEVHEFIADREMILNGIAKDDYAKLLFEKTFMPYHNNLINTFFNQSLLKKRIMMLQKQKSKRVAILKYGLSTPLFIVALMLSSSVLGRNNTVKQVMKKIEPAVLNQLLETKKNILLDNNDRKPDELNNRESKLPGNSIKSRPESNEELINVDTLTPGTVKKTDPAFPGGANALYKFLFENLKYPEEARQKNINGKVVVSFNIEEDGTIKDLKVMKGLEESLDQETLRVMALSPKWIPGTVNDKPEKMSITIPFQFGTRN